LQGKSPLCAQTARIFDIYQSVGGEQWGQALLRPDSFCLTALAAILWQGGSKGVA